ncbi:hypothetical protein TNCT_444801 [Trichonephila clavata]|uniref:Uncharacterized protein n=1 Tax=Trichonephila clavata TaxID=2740835 RepID=A0A8X6GB77_TRICU|nr:hypothetical protein TNCT_444801 [Trichonephila clavata]
MYPRRVPKSLSSSEDSQVGSIIEDSMSVERETPYGNVSTTTIAKEDETLGGDYVIEDAALFGDKATEEATVILKFSETVAEAESVTHTVDADIKVVGAEDLTTRTKTTESLNQETSKFIKTESTTNLDFEKTDRRINRPERRNELDALNNDSNSQGNNDITNTEKGSSEIQKIFDYTNKFVSHEKDKQLDAKNTVAETDEKRIVLRQDNQMRENWKSRFQGPWVPRNWTNDIKTSGVKSVLPDQRNKTEVETFGLWTKAERLGKNGPKTDRSSKYKTEPERFKLPEDKTEAESPPKGRIKDERFRHPEDRIEAEIPSKDMTGAERFRHPEERTEAERPSKNRAEAERFRFPEDSTEAERFRLPENSTEAERFRSLEDRIKAERPSKGRTETERFRYPEDRTETERLRFLDDRTEAERFRRREDKMGAEIFRLPEDERSPTNRRESEGFGLPKNRTASERLPKNRMKAERSGLPTNRTAPEILPKNRTASESLPKNRTEAERLAKKTLKADNLKYSESEKLSKGQWEEACMKGSGSCLACRGISPYCHYNFRGKMCFYADVVHGNVIYECGIRFYTSGNDLEENTI